MKVSNDDLAYLMKGARLVDATQSDAYWHYCASRFRGNPKSFAIQVAWDGVRLFSNQNEATLNHWRRL